MIESRIASFQLQLGGGFLFAAMLHITYMTGAEDSFCFKGIAVCF